MPRGSTTTKRDALHRRRRFAHPARQVDVSSPRSSADRRSAARWIGIGLLVAGPVLIVLVAVWFAPRPQLSSPVPVAAVLTTDEEGAALLPGGDFTMGSLVGGPDCRPLHRVTLSSFWIDPHEVTNSRFAEFVDMAGYVTQAERRGGGWVFDTTQRKWDFRAGANWRQPTGPESTIVGREQDPVVQVSWDDAAAYAEWAGARLPTEAEWEYAARGGLADADYPWGHAELPGNVYQANYWQGQFPFKDLAADGYAGIAPVAHYPANPWGLYDMAGNVAEWTADLYAQDFYPVSPPENPPGPPQGTERVVRGGSWISANNTGGKHRIWVRDKLRPDAWNNHTGFRCARDHRE